jgi:hypothetical protein
MIHPGRGHKRSDRLPPHPTRPKPKLSKEAMWQSAYRKRVAEGKRHKLKRLRCYRLYLRDLVVDALIVKAARVLDPADPADALVLEEIKIIEKSDFNKPEERQAFVARVIERLLLTSTTK